MRFQGENFYVVAGSVIEWGGNSHLDFVNAAVLPILQATGRFTGISARWVSGWINPYIVIRVTSTSDRGRLVDVMADIEGAFYQAGEAPQSQAMYVVSAPLTSRANAATTGSGGMVAINEPQWDGTEFVIVRPDGTVVPSVTADYEQRQMTPDQRARYEQDVQRLGLQCPDGYQWSFAQSGCVPKENSWMPSFLKGGVERLAADLGVTYTQAAVIGAVGALLALAAIKKAL